MFWVVQVKARLQTPTASSVAAAVAQQETKVAPAAAVAHQETKVASVAPAHQETKVYAATAHQETKQSIYFYVNFANCYFNDSSFL